LAALESDKLDRAVLDVFNVEPLPENHPFWQHPKITVTHHTAAITQIKDVAALFVDNAQRFLNNEPLLHVLDWERGY
jgi:phosphoglycerate dehydrogenase-like enzyme